jgi:hypothetical protein
MKTKIIITENQFKKLKVRITEESTHFLAVQQLKKNWWLTIPVEKVARKGGEYVTTVMIKNNTDEEEMSVSDLRDYIDFKFKFNGKIKILLNV